MPSEGLLRRIKRFERSIRRLSKLKMIPRDEVLASDDSIDVLENNTRIAVEALLDVGRFIIAAEDWERPSSYREIPRILHRHNVLGAREATILEQLAGLRNIIVHLYADIDYEALLDVLELLGAMEDVMARMLSYIERRGIDP